MNRKLYTKETGKSWNKLCNRLEQDGLLTKNGPSTDYVRKRTVFWWSLAAVAVVVLFLAVASIVLLQNRTQPPLPQDLLSQQNDDEVSTLVTTLEDGSVVYLAGNTSLKYPKHFAPQERRVMLSGDALFDVAGNKARPFYIETKQAKIVVVGTAFNVKTLTPDSLVLAVNRGEVCVVMNDREREIYVKAGETLALSNGTFQLSPTTDSKQFDRYTRQMRFKDERLGNVLRVMNRQSKEVKLCTMPELENRTLTVSFTTETPDEIAGLICLALHLQASRRNGVILLSEQN